MPIVHIIVLCAGDLSCVVWRSSCGLLGLFKLSLVVLARTSHIPSPGTKTSLPASPPRTSPNSRQATHSEWSKLTENYAHGRHQSPYPSGPGYYCPQLASRGCCCHPEILRGTSRGIMELSFHIALKYSLHSNVCFPTPLNSPKADWASDG